MHADFWLHHGTQIQYQTISPRAFDHNTSFSSSILNLITTMHKKQPICYLSIIVRSKSIYLEMKFSFLTPPSTGERLSSPFLILSLALKSILAIRPLLTYPQFSIYLPLEILVPQNACHLPLYMFSFALKSNLRRLETVSSTFKDLDFDGSL